MPTARVALDGQHIYTSWFDDPSLDDFKAGRVYTSFALDIAKPGTHTIRISFDDFAHGTRWRVPRWKGDEKPPVTYSKNDLRPHHVGSIAIGIDERVRALEKISLKPELRGKHPRLDYGRPAGARSRASNLSLKDVEAHTPHVDPDRAKPWEYSIDAESMASDNDMDAGRKGAGAARTYDLHVARLSPEAKKEWDRVFLKRFQQFYTFFVFQRNFHPTGYAQNHSSATVGAILAAGLVWDGPEAEKWLRWGVMTCRKRIELYGRDGGVEWMNEARDYGLAYFQQPLAADQARHGRRPDQGPPLLPERMALRPAPGLDVPDRPRPPAAHAHAGPRVPWPREPQRAGPRIGHDRRTRRRTGTSTTSIRSSCAPTGPTRRIATRLWAGSVFGKQGSKIAKRYNWAHCPVNQGSFVLSKGKHEIILEAGWTRDYRRTRRHQQLHPRQRHRPVGRRPGLASAPRAGPDRPDRLLRRRRAA